VGDTGFLVNTGKQLILVDAGAGTWYGGGALGRLVDSLRKAGYGPEEIDSTIPRSSTRCQSCRPISTDLRERPPPKLADAIHHNVSEHRRIHMTLINRSVFFVVWLTTEESEPCRATWPLNSIAVPPRIKLFINNATTNAVSFPES
jgi:hypothetical protein